jgi:hypothetical protein
MFDWSVSPAIRYVIIDSAETYMWDLVTVKNLHELLAEFPIKVPQPRSGALVNSTAFSFRSLVRTHTMANYFCNISWPNLRWSGENAYMWDPGTIYDYLEHSILK